MFGLSFGEVVLLALIAMVVIGPRELPRMMRELGRAVAKLRRVTTELREQSGIDEILRAEGIEREVQELRKIATGRILDVDLYDGPRYEDLPPRSREYPTAGADSYGAITEDVAPYAPPPSPPKLVQPEGTIARGRENRLPQDPEAELATPSNEPAPEAPKAGTGTSG